VLARRGALVEAALWAATFLAANLAEVVSKGLLTRPPLAQRQADHLVHLVSFDASYPSGHALRTCLIAALVLRLWPRAWPPTVAWAGASLVLLVAAGVHTVTDVVGGALLAGLAVALVLTGQERLVSAGGRDRSSRGSRAGR
jgi:membrane-associated phospholipid phosphatase